MEGDIRDSYSSNEICVAHIASLAIFGQYSGFLLHLGNKGDLSHLHNIDIRLLYYLSFFSMVLIRSIGLVGSSSGSPPYLCKSFNRIPAINISSEYAIQGNRISNKSIGIEIYVIHEIATTLTHIGDLLNCSLYGFIVCKNLLLLLRFTPAVLVYFV